MRGDRDSYRLQEAATPGVPPAGGEMLALLRLRLRGFWPRGSASMGMDTGSGTGSGGASAGDKWRRRRFENGGAGGAGQSGAAVADLTNQKPPGRR